MPTMSERPPLRLLSLDGGGVRGYSMLMLLQEVMLKTFVELHGRAPKRDEIPRPCDHFDLICGTGTGGIIALLLGRMRLDIDACLEIYTEMSAHIFVSSKTIANVPYGKTLYKASKLEESFKIVANRFGARDDLFDARILKRSGYRVGNSDGRLRANPNLNGTSFNGHGNKMPGSNISLRSESSGENSGKRSSYSTQHGNGSVLHTGRPGTSMAQTWGDHDNLPLYDDREERCKTFVTAVYKNAPNDTPPARLRTYDSSLESSPCGDCAMWEAGRATTAIYPAFKEMQIGQVIFCDEGPGKFNPVHICIDEARNEWPDRDIGVLVSIGSGKLPDSVTNANETRSKMKTAFLRSTPLNKIIQSRDHYISKITECEAVHQNLVEEIDTTGLLRSDCYFRLNVDQDVGNSAQNEYQRLADISTNTRTYLAQPKMQQQNRSCAQKLARIHHLRHARDYTPSPPVNKRPLRPVPLPSAFYSNRELPVLPLNPGPAPPRPSRSPHDFGLQPAPPYIRKRSTLETAGTPISTAPPEAKVVVPREPSEMWDSEGEDEDIAKHIAGLKKIAETIEEERRRDYGGGNLREGRGAEGHDLRDSFGRSDSPAFSDDACDLAYCYNGLGIAISN